ncbi:MAG TPA: hypothetical protein VNE62_01295 [Actinomycetota bacterium]|nr:hypothetical protein [Actinomycetota bacterium]
MGKRKTQIDFEWLAAEVAAARQIDPQGGVSFAGWALEELRLVAMTGLQLPDDVSDDEAQSIAWSGLKAAAEKHADLTGKRLDRELKRAAAEFLRKPLNPFVLYTTVTLSRASRVKGARLDGVTISLQQVIPRRFDRSFVSGSMMARDLEDDSRFLKVRVRVQARTPSSAVRSAMSSLHFLRGAWNLSLNRPRWREWAVDQTKPFNKIRPGPLHTLHHLSGRPAAQAYWYEPFFRPDVLSLSGSKLAGVERETARIRTLARASSYGAELRRAVSWYCTALDLPDPQLAFLKLWGLLEYLTDTSFMRHEDTIDRVLFLYQDPGVDRHVLQFLKDHRNRSVHAGADAIDREMLVLLHRFAVRLLLTALQSGRVFRSRKEFGQFLGLPGDADQLMRRLAVLREAIRFRGAGKHTGAASAPIS